MSSVINPNELIFEPSKTVREERNAFNRFKRHIIEGHLTSDDSHLKVSKTRPKLNRNSYIDENGDCIMRLVKCNFRVQSYDILMGDQDYFWSSESDLVIPSPGKGYFTLNTETCDMRCFASSELPSAVEVKSDRVTSHIIYNGDWHISPFNPRCYTMMVGLDFLEISRTNVTLYKRF